MKSPISTYALPEGGQIPGKYVVDIYLNKNPVDHREVTFIAYKGTNANDKTGLVPCFTEEELKDYGIKTDAALAMIKRHGFPDACRHERQYGYRNSAGR